MAEQKKNILIEYSLILLIFAGVAGFILAGVYQVTEPLKLQNQQKIETLSRQEVLPSANRFENSKIKQYPFVKGFKDKELVGYICKVSSRGYSSSIDVMIGLDKQFNLVGIKILSQAETPGLGTKVTEPWFLKQFMGQTGALLLLKKDGGALDAITGATISSRAVTDGTRREIERFSELMKKKEKQKK